MAGSLQRAVIRCDHPAWIPRYARGLCRKCYWRFYSVVRKRERRAAEKITEAKAIAVAKAARLPMPVGDRIELWVWEKEYWDISETSDELVWQHDRDVWAVELRGQRITGAFGLVETKGQRRRPDLRIIRDPVVIGVMEARRNEFKRLAA